MSREMALTVALVAVAWVVPLLLLVVGLVRSRGSPKGPRWNWRSFVLSTLLCTIAFNLTFFLQEFFLVLPKAMVPGLNPTLFHNDHHWTGSARIAELFEGTGAVAILVIGLASKATADRARSPSTLATFVLWMAFEGLFQSLPQFVLGAIIPGNDVERSYAYLHLAATARLVIGLVALAAIPAAGIWIGRSFLSLAAGPSAAEGWRSRTAILARSAAAPALAAVPLIVLFRIPREPVEVVVLPLLVQLMGAAWVLASARTPQVSARGTERHAPRLWPACLATVLLLAIFQLVLRSGVRFY